MTATNTRAIVALDVPSFDTAIALVERLGDACEFYKVGLELYSADGPRVVRWLRKHGKSVFVDLKAHDIPNTVRGAARRVADLGASLFTVHAAGGEAMVRAAVDGAGPQTESGCAVLAVTVLTSFDAASYGAATGRSPVTIADEVARLSGVAKAAGAFGVVCSGHEAAMVRDGFGGSLRILVPGVRAAGADSHDQSRVVTAAQAAAAGASYIVLGRAVTQAGDPASALRGILGEL